VTERAGRARGGAFARAALIAAALVLLAAPPATAQEAAPNLDAEQATRASDPQPDVQRQRGLHPDLTSSAELEEGEWEVSYFAGDEQVALVIVDDATGLVEESWTGHQVAWKMARGYEGAFGHMLNAPYVFLPLCALFLIGLVDWRRPWRVANLDLLVLLAFGASHFFFNQAEIGVSVPLQYPPLLYLLARCLWIGVRGRAEGLRPVWPAAWLLVAALFLVGFRVGLNLADSGVIDVGYAGVVGADRIADGAPVYGGFPDDVAHGDTYGPLNYYAYLPFEQVWPWSGSWDSLPAAHGAAVFFDLGTFALLLLLGLRLRPGRAGRGLAATLGFGWAAYPYTAYVLESNSNDSLIALLLVATLLVIGRPALRGSMLALAALTKFAPVLLVPLLATVEGRRRPPLLFAAGFGAAAILVGAQTVLEPGLATLYERTIGYQAGRHSPFSVWGQAPALEPLRVGVIAATGALALALGLRPRRKDLVQVSALGAALLIAVQLTMQHWFYLYLVWFFPLLLVALATVSQAPGPAPARSSQPARRDERPPPRPSPRRPPRRSRSEPASV
jgi:hypothetical protein